jgi:hypothetical protein
MRSASVSEHLGEPIGRTANMLLYAVASSLKNHV